MRLQLPTLLFVCLVGIAGISCKSGSSTATTPSPVGQNSNSNSVTVTIPAGDVYNNNGSTFTPATVNVPVGTTVTWSNRDSVTHTTTSDTNVWSGDLAAGGTYSRQFSTKGTFAYKCLLHAGMTGTITVQ
jgi:plastocyanin